MDNASVRDQRISIAPSCLDGDGEIGKCFGYKFRCTTWETESLFNSLADRDLNDIVKLLIVCGTSRERTIVQLRIFTNHCVKGQDFECSTNVELPGEVEVEVNSTDRPFSPLKSSAAGRRALNSFEGFFQHGEGPDASCQLVQMHLGRLFDGRGDDPTFPLSVDEIPVRFLGPLRE